LFELDYRLYWHLPPLFHAQNFANQAGNVFGGIVPINMIGIPHVMASSFSPPGFREITSPDDRWQS
jgi:hypothetical protein